MACCSEGDPEAALRLEPSDVFSGTERRSSLIVELRSSADLQV